MCPWSNLGLRGQLKGTAVKSQPDLELNEAVFHDAGTALGVENSKGSDTAVRSQSHSQQLQQKV